MRIVQAAIEADQVRSLEQAYWGSLATAQLSALFASAHGDKRATLQRYHPVADIQALIRARNRWPTKTAKLIVQLLDDRRIPNWVLQQLGTEEVELIRKVAEG